MSHQLPTTIDGFTEKTERGKYINRLLKLHTHIHTQATHTHTQSKIEDQVGQVYIHLVPFKILTNWILLERGCKFYLHFFPFQKKRTQKYAHVA